MTTYTTLPETLQSLPTRKIIWLMVPSKFVDDVLGEVKPTLNAGDVVIDGGNSFYKDTLRRSEERFRVVATATNDVIYEWNTEGDALLWYGNIDRALGYPPGGFPRTMSGWMDAIHPEDRAAMQVQVERIRAQGGTVDISYRIAAADANPYVILAAVIASGLWGIEHEADIEAMVEGNAYDQTFPEHLHLSANLLHAAQRLKASDIARGYFGDEFVDHFAATREWEVREFDKHISDWELQRYFEII